MFFHQMLIEEKLNGVGHAEDNAIACIAMQWVWSPTTPFRHRLYSILMH